MSRLVPLLSFALILLSLFFFIITIAAAQANTSAFPNCLPTYCNRLMIGYPFWKIDDQTNSDQYCGYEGFGINCTIIDGQDHPIMSFGGASYYVGSLTDTHITLVDYDVSSVAISPAQSRCPRVKHGIELETLPLNFTSKNLNLSFHFNCSSVPGFATLIPCLDYGSRRSCVNVIKRENENYEWGELGCDEEVVTTVLDVFRPNERLDTEYGGALSTGFELNWRITTEQCDKCEESDGRCGNSSSTGFMCFCSDGTSTKDNCKDGWLGGNHRWWGDSRRWLKRN